MTACTGVKCLQYTNRCEWKHNLKNKSRRKISASGVNENIFNKKTYVNVCPKLYTISNHSWMLLATPYQVPPAHVVWVAWCVVHQSCRRMPVLAMWCNGRSPCKPALTSWTCRSTCTQLPHHDSICEQMDIKLQSNTLFHFHFHQLCSRYG